MNVAMLPKFGVGASVLRKEDNNFIKGAGRYTDDISVPGMLHGYVLRSPIANGTFRIGSIEAAQAAPGVHLVLTAADLGHLGDMKPGMLRPMPPGTIEPTRNIPILCKERVAMVGDAVAFIVADSKALAQDASELIEIDYAPEAAIVSTGNALDPDAPLVWPDRENNLALHYEFGDSAKADEAFARADHVTRVEYVNNKLVSNYMEPRAAIGEWNADEERYVLTCPSQGVHVMRDILCDYVFDIPRDRMRTITPDVGGGFGPKHGAYREYVLVLEAARRIGRPVKWTGDRTEHFMVDAQGRDNVVKAEMAMDREGRFLGLRARLIGNLGAYVHQFGPYILFVGPTMVPGTYDIQNVHMSMDGVYTNTTPTDAYRGAGRPEACFLMEKLVDACARDMKMTQDEIRRRNFIRPDQMPYTTPTGRVYDSGDFQGSMEQCMALARWESFAERERESRARGRLRGIGMASYIEISAFPGKENVRLQLEKDGTATLFIGTQSNGQGHATVYPQLVADRLGLDVSRINVRQGDTDEMESGGGTAGSRSIPVGSMSAIHAGDDLAEKIRRIAADKLEASAADIELVGGTARIVGTDRALDLAEIAAAADPQDVHGAGHFEQVAPTYPNGTQICEVEIDPETGRVEIVDFTMVDDVGVTMNPILCAGQMHGGVAQGLGQALTEEVVYSEEGQLLTASFMDYAVPRADILPTFRHEMRNVPCTTNPLGLKGAGESGTTGSTPAAVIAVTDALWREYGIDHVEMPATAQRIWKAIQEAKVGRK